MKTQQITILANAADQSTPFQILQPDGFMVPYGKYPHKQGLQIFDREAAAEIVKAHNSSLSKHPHRGTGGSYPVYVGHPDLPGSKDTDKRAYGWIENMAVREQGLHLSVKWSDEGRKLVENAHFKFYSPLWWLKKVNGGMRPIALKSMGLTNDPNIPVPALANESDTSTAKDTKTTKAGDARAMAVAKEYAATNPALSVSERKNIAWRRARKNNPELFGEVGDDPLIPAKWHPLRK
jgi:hypothetical protein